MNLQGKDLISTATQKSARALIVIASTVLVAKIYAVPIDTLSVFGLAIPHEAITAAVWLFILFQIINHTVHWTGDWHASEAWNSRERVNSLPGFGAASDLLAKLDAAIEKVEMLANDERMPLALRSPESAQEYLDEVKRCKTSLETISGQVRDFRAFAAFYFFGWYFLLPVGMGATALLWPSAQY